MNSIKFNKILILLLVAPLILTSCKGPDGGFKLPGGDARKFPDDPQKRVEQNIREGKGFRINDAIKRGGGTFDFASSNELWRASLDVIDFMPLLSVNYSGGIIVTDWYSENNSPNESIKISIRFLTNEIRSDALDVKIFNRVCIDTLINCTFSDSNENLSKEIAKQILKKAAIYKSKKTEESSNKDYKYPQKIKKKKKK
ncbi:DUF3576 domain-containing protein [Candidatus Pelagibacter sp.]|uniref:DUF3576 domain-containing protein n=1 Tax=Candidatus Pelagibacter sp. TaxID=2024849 RepID=UPI003F828F99